MEFLCLLGATLFSCLWGDSDDCDEYIDNPPVTFKGNPPHIPPDLKVIEVDPRVPAPVTLRDQLENEGVGLLYQELRLLEDSMHGDRLRDVESAFPRLAKFMTLGCHEDGSIVVQSLLTCAITAKNCEFGHNSHYASVKALPSFMLVYGAKPMDMVIAECHLRLQDVIPEVAFSDEDAIEGMESCEIFMRALVPQVCELSERMVSNG